MPFLGICLGLQCAVIEFARNVCGLEGANSSEFDPATPHAVIDLLPEQKNVTDLGGSMRLGAQPCHLVPGTLAASAYGEEVVYERHRHRWEVNPAYHEVLEQAGWCSRGTPITAGSPRSSSCPTTLSSSPASSTRSSGPVRPGRTRCSASSSARRRRYRRARADESVSVG